MNLQMLKMALIAYVNSAKAIWSVIAHPLSIISKKATMLKDYRIYGNSVQDGEPTPDNPIEVQSVGELTTKNLFDIDSCLNECLTKNDDGTYTLKKITENSRFSNWASIYIPANTNCARGLDIVELNRPSGSSVAVYVQFEFDDGTSGTFSLYDNKQGSATSGHHVSTFSKNVVKIRFYMDWSEAVGDYITFKNAQFEIGNTTTEYEPYHKYKVPVTVRGKNLWTEDNYLVSNSSTEVILKELSPDKNSWVKVGTTIVLSITAFISENDGRQNPCLSFQTRYTDNTVGGYKTQRYSDKGKELHTSFSYTIPQTEKEIKSLQIRFFDYGSSLSGVRDAYVKDIQIELGNTPTSFEPYIEPQTHNIYLDEPLRKIGDYADVVDFEKGVVVRNIGEIVVTSAMVKSKNQWYYERNWNAYMIPFSDFKSYFDQYQSGDYSNYFKSTPNGYTSASLGDNNVFQLSRGTDIYIITTPASDETVDEIRAWVDEKYNEGNPLKFTLRRAESVEEPIYLPNLPQFKGTTVYEVQHDIPPSCIEVCYYE